MSSSSSSSLALNGDVTSFQGHRVLVNCAIYHHRHHPNLPSLSVAGLHGSVGIITYSVSSSVLVTLYTLSSSCLTTIWSLSWRIYIPISLSSLLELYSPFAWFCIYRSPSIPPFDVITFVTVTFPYPKSQCRHHRHCQHRNWSSSSSVLSIFYPFSLILFDLALSYLISLDISSYIAFTQILNDTSRIFF